MREIHVDGVAPLVIIKVVKGRVFNGSRYLIDNDGKTLFIEKGRIVVSLHWYKAPLLLIVLVSVKHKKTRNAIYK